MAKSLRSFTLDLEVADKLEQIENKSELVNNLLKTYFGTADYTAGALEKARARMQILQEQFNREQANANRIIIEEKQKEFEIQEAKKAAEEVIKQQEEAKARRKEEMIKLVETHMDLAKRAKAGEDIVTLQKEYKARGIDIDQISLIKYKDEK